METPLYIILSPEYQLGLKTDHGLPENYLYKIPFASPLLLSDTNGNYLSQSFNGVDYWLELLSFSLHTNGSIYLHLPTSVMGFIFLLQGNLGEQWMGNRMVNALKGTYAAFYIPAGKYPLTLFKGEYNLLYLIPPSDYFKSMALEHPSVQQLLNHITYNDLNGFMTDQFYFPLAVLRIIKSMERCTKKGAALDLVLRSYILKLLSFYNQQLKEKTLNRPFHTNEEIAFAVKEHIMANLSNINLGRLKELTQHFPITSKTLTREFRKSFGKTVPEFIREERLKLAHQLLLQPNKQVQEVAIETGYDYLSHFSREFKKKFGYSPGALAKKKNNDSNLSQ